MRIKNFDWKDQEGYDREYYRDYDEERDDVSEVIYDIEDDELDDRFYDDEKTY